MNLRYMVVMAGVVCLSFAATPAQAAADMPARMMMHSMQDMMMAKQAKVGQPAPEFILDGVIGTESGKEFTTISLSDYSGKWLVLFFYPLDFTLVCPTEIKGFNEALPQFKKLGAEVLGVSVDSKFSHLAWIKRGDLGKLNYPLLSDIRREAAKQYGVLDEAEGIAQRGLFVIDPEGILQYQVVHNMDVGRSVEETLRVLEALQSGALCPLGWKPGQKAIGK
ncbi:peroxiredoxin [Geotalea toluenoxydans]